MKKRIDRLTPEQEASMPGHAQAWIERGLSCQPAEQADLIRLVHD